MAGSLNHIVTRDGAFTMAQIENFGDAQEALEECFDVIAALLNIVRVTGDPAEVLNHTLDVLNFPAAKAVPRLGRRAEDV